MAEILSFAEGTGQLALGGGSFVTQFYVRDVRLTPQRLTNRYRPPYSLTHTHVDLQSGPATLSFGVAESPHITGIKGALHNATPGTVHFHIFAVTPGVNNSGGFYCYSGTLEGGDFAGSEGEAEQRFSVNGWFETWTAY